MIPVHARFIIAEFSPTPTRTLSRGNRGAEQKLLDFSANRFRNRRNLELSGGSTGE